VPLGQVSLEPGDSSDNIIVVVLSTLLRVSQIARGIFCLMISEEERLVSDRDLLLRATEGRKTYWKGYYIRPLLTKE
jgi:hypothetical protein